MFHKKLDFIWALSIAWLFTLTAHAAPPDLTGPGVIAGIDRTNTYNLGATGLRGWIWVDRNNKGDTGQITDQSRQILVTHCVAPASSVLAVDDVILGAIAASTGTVPNFPSDCRKAFGTTIGDAEKTVAGTLRVKIWRAGLTSEVNITLPILGNYNATAPFNNCPKSTAILNGVRNKMVADLLANSNYLNGGFSGSANALALLSGVKPGDPNYNEVQTRLQTFARSLSSAGPENEGLTSWGNSYALIYLSEYYLITTDSQVVTGIQNFTLKLAQSQSIYGTYGHGAAAIRPDSSGRLYSTGYGPVNAVGGTAAIALVLGKKALVAAGQLVDPQIDAAIQRSSGFFAFYVNKGAIPYGEHEPVITSHASNSKDATPAVFFALQSGKAVEAEYFARISVSGWIGREYGHTGQGLGYYWATLGALMGGPEAASEHLKQVRWHLDLSRRTDGSFAYDGQEQYGPGTTKDNTYLGEAEYGGMTANAIYLLTYSLPLQRLYITGKNAIPAYTLNSTKVASAIAAGSFRLDRGAKSISELFTAIGDYDPIVRNYASIELASRTLSGTDLTNLRNLLSSADPNLRQSACQTLGIRQDSTSLSTIVALLNDPDLWVRAKAAIATRAYSPAVSSTHRDSIMSSFIANATDPEVINWSDPIQICNGKLGNAIFGQGVNDSAPTNDIASYTINAPKQTLLYPALRAGLKQPDSYARLSATLFCRQNLPLVDAQAVYPEVANAAEFDTPADRMWSGACRADAITMLAALKITDAIPLTLAMLNSAPGFEWGEKEPRIGALNALASYGDAARYTLPTLKAYLNQWSPTAEEYPVLVNTINTIENAITAPAQAPGLCVANSDVVTTTGTTAITLTGASPRGSFTYLNVTQPAHGTITGTAPNLTYTPTGGYTGLDQFTFQTNDTLTTSTVATVGIIVGPSGNGLKGEYFNNTNFTSLAHTRVDPQINFDWGTGSPHASVGADTFSVRWSGVLLVPQSGNYTFSALTSDGVRLYINGNLVIDRFVDQSTRWTDSSPVYLTAGQYAEIYVEYYENTGDAVAKLKWTGPAFAGANGNFIPEVYLFDGSGISNRPAYAFPQSLTTNLNTPMPILLNGSGGTLSYTILSQPTNGTLSGTSPNLTYTPNTNFSGTDSFTFLVNNGTTNSLPATVSINVQAGPLTSFTWSTPVSGNWNETTKWTSNIPAAAGLPTYALNFTSAGTYTATHNLNNGFQLNQLNAAANVTLDGTQSVSFVANGGSLPQLNQMGADVVRVSHPISLAAMTTIGGTGGGRVILNGVISGAGGIVKNSPGILQIGQRTNSYSGGTVLNAGTVEMPAGEGELTPALGSGTITLNQGAVLSVNRNFLSNHMVLNGGTITGGNSFPTILNGSITLNGILNFDFAGGGFEISGNISGPGGFTYTGPFNPWSELPCGGTNTYTGPTTVLSGTLSFPSVNSVPPGPMILSGDSKLKLNFTGTRVIESFTLNGVLMAPGIYGSTTSPASHQDDTYFAGNGTLTILPTTATSLNLTTGSSPADPGTSLTFTATVTGSSPMGDVEFFSGTTLLGTSVMDGSSQATFTTNQLAIGPNSVTARYVGNASNSPSTSLPTLVEINNTTTAAPTNLTAMPAGTQINLAWTASPGASGYYVKRSSTNGGPYAVTAFVSGGAYEDPSILPNVTYYYVISAINSAGESSNSNHAEAWIAQYTVTFDANGGSQPAPLSKQVLLGATYDVLPTTSRAGHTFTGWFTAASDGTQVTSDTAVTTTADHTLYAQWIASTYAVTYDGNGNTGGVAPTNDTKTYDVALTLATAETMVRTGYSFAGWNSAADGSGTTYAAGTSYTDNAVIALYAQWTANIYTVTFDANGGTSADPANKQVVFDATYGTLATTSRAGYVFTGWFTQASDGTKVETSTTVTTADNHTLFARWANSFTWDANDTNSGQTNGGGAWLGDNLWWNGVGNQNWVSGINAIIGGVASNGGNLTLASPTTVNSITFNQFTSTYTVGTAGQAITINNGITKNASSGSATIISPITLGAAQAWTNNNIETDVKAANGTLNITGGVDNAGSTLTFYGTGTTSLSNTSNFITGSGGLTKNGAGVLILGAGGTVPAHNYSGTITINGGGVRINGATSYGTGNLTINNGYLESYFGTSFARTLGSGVGQVRILGGVSGFSEQGSSSTVTLNNDAAFEVVWGWANEAGNSLATGFFNPSVFVLQADTVNSGKSITFANKLDLNGTTRTIYVGKDSATTATLSGVVRSSTGAAGLIKEGAGTLLLDALSPAFSGDITISAGTLRVGNNNSTARLGAATYSGNVSNNGTLWFTHNQNQEFTGVISGAGTLNKGGSGTLTLSGANTYTGKTIIEGSGQGGPSVSVSSFNSINGGAPTMASSSLGAPTTELNGTIQLGSGTNQRSCFLIYTGPGESTDRVINFGFNSSSSHTLTASGSGLLKFTSPMTANTLTTQSGKLNLGGTGSGEITQALPALPSGGLSKIDTGTWSLGGANSYTGPTNITVGKLFINGNETSATGNVSVSASATLGGTGVIGGSTTIAAGGKLEFNLSTAPISHDKLALAASKTLSFGTNATITINSVSGATTGDYILLTAPGGIGTLPALTLNLPSGWSANVTRENSNTDLVLHVTFIGGMLDHFAISSIASQQTLDTPITGITITAQDAANQTVTSFTGTVTLGGTTGISGTSANFAAGVLTGVSVTPGVIGSNLTLTVDDGSGHTGSATFDVQSVFEGWADASGLTGLDAVFGANPDGDSLTNLQEFAFGMNPNSPAISPLSYVANETTIPGTPILEKSEGIYRAVFARRKNYRAAGLTYTVSFSADLIRWTDAETTPPPTRLSGDNADTLEAVSVNFPATVPLQGGEGASPKFFRVTVSGN